MKHANPKVIAEQQKFADHLQTRGLRPSSGRMKVFNVVMKTHGHFAPEEIVKACREKGIKVSRATIYRSIHELLESGVIRETAFGEKHSHYEHIYDEKPHHHARCVRCCAFIEIPDLEEEKRYRPILEEQGFQILGHELHFYGICRECVVKEK